MRPVHSPGPKRTDEQFDPGDRVGDRQPDAHSQHQHLRGAHCFHLPVRAVNAAAQRGILVVAAATRQLLAGRAIPLGSVRSTGAGLVRFFD
ncbi:hypothetical protein [Laceyella putida]|uniref:Uncharacterized protein n=1 Tax=Laceyella putida TaxID=110101 RepID=A0ABW2RJ73_9BACL